MATPCILAVGTRDAWRGVPVKYDGVEESAGVTVIDRVVRAAGVAAAAKALVDDAPLGWSAVGDERLTQLDDFLTGPDGTLSQRTPKEVLDRHYAIYVLDATHRRLEVFVGTSGRWLDPAVFDDAGAVVTLPGWYPQPRNDHEIRAISRPEEVTKALRDYCLAKDLRWPLMTGALTRFIERQLDDAKDCRWLYLAGIAPGPHVRVYIGDVAVTASLGAYDTTFTASDGRLRTLDLADMTGAARAFTDVGLKAMHAEPTIEKWLTPAYVYGSGGVGSSVFLSKSGSGWYFNKLAGNVAPELVPERVHALQKRLGDFRVVEEDPLPIGYLPTLLAWLF